MRRCTVCLCKGPNAGGRIAQRALTERKGSNMNASMSPNPRPRVAVLGLGTMGDGMARRLLEAALAAAGAAAHVDAAEAVARADVLLTMLPTADAVSEVVLGGGVLDAVRPGTTWAQMGTIGVESTEYLAAGVARRRPDV